MATPALQESTATGCCPRFDPAPWDETEVDFANRWFVKDRVRCLFHVPINFGGLMARNLEKIDAAGAKDDDMIVLSDPNSLWGADVYISVRKPVPDSDCVEVPGRFLAKVFEGPYRDIRKWCGAMDDHVAARGKTRRRSLFYYTTCPKCAKAYGKNYVVLLAEV